MVYILSFINKDIKVIGDMGCILLKELNDCIHTENESFKINVKQFNSEYFKRFIMDEELDRDELNVEFSTNLKTGPYYEFINYTDNDFEKMFIELGYFGAEKQIKQLRNIVKNVIRYKYINCESIQKLMEHFGCINYKNPNIDENFIRKIGYDIADYDPIIQNPNISFNFLRKLNIRTCKLDRSPNFPESFYETFKKYNNVYYIARFARLEDEKIINEIINEDENNIYELFKNVNIKDTVFKRIIDENKIDIDYALYILSKNANVSEDFYITYIDHIDNNISGNLFKHPKISKKFIEKYIEIKGKENIRWDLIVQNINIHEDFIEKYIEYIQQEYLLCAVNINIVKIKSVFENLMKLYINNHSKQISILSDLCNNPSLNDDFFEYIINMIPLKLIPWDILARNSCISENFILKYCNYFCGEDVQYNTFRYNHKINYENHILGKYL